MAATTHATQQRRHDASLTCHSDHSDRNGGIKRGTDSTVSRGRGGKKPGLTGLHVLF